MTILIFGLVIFLGTHSLRIFGEGWRSQTIRRIGTGPYKGAFAIASILGFVLIVWGFGMARQQPVQLWSPPTGMRHLAALLTLGAFILLAAAYVPGNGLKARVHHPMVLAVKVWAIAHLLANGNLAHVVLFGSFLVWAVLDFSSSRRRDRLAGTVYPPGDTPATIQTVVVGIAAWALFAFWLHGLLMGVRPFA